MSKTFLLHHIVFATKRRENTINVNNKKELYAYIMGIVQNKKCRLIRINGMPDHVHMLVDLHPTVAIAELVKDVKQSSSRWLKNNPAFPGFDCWGEGYYAVSVGVDGLEACRQYIMNQESHHGRLCLLDEMERMAHSYGLRWYRDDWD